VCATIAELVGTFDSLAESAQTLTFAPRALELQLGMCQEIEVFLGEVRRAKAGAVARSDENTANHALAMELSLKVVWHELQMWICLKSDAGERAWDNLVEAQYHCMRAIDVREQLEGFGSAQGLQNLLSKFLLIERTAFPPQAFMSVGGRIKRRVCSICQCPYDQCEHIRGRAYMGEMCATSIEEMDLEEVSIVTEPANKHCRVTHFSDPAGRRNKMTWRVEACENAAPDEA
jgi:hypothetical protein